MFTFGDVMINLNDVRKVSLRKAGGNFKCYLVILYMISGLKIAKVFDNYYEGWGLREKILQALKGV